MVLRLWDQQTGGATNGLDELYAEQQTVIVNNGYFSVQLGQGSQYANEPFQAGALAGYFATNSSTGNTPRYWETTVLGIGPNGGNITIAPRLACLSAPYAFLAANAVNAANLVNATGTQLITAYGNAVNVNGTAFNIAGILSGNGSGLTSLNAGNISSGILSIAQGGTGSGTQNYVDLSSAQNIGGAKSFTGNVGIGTAANANAALLIYGGPLGFSSTPSGTPYVGMDYDSNSDSLRLRAAIGTGFLNGNLMTIKRTTGLVGFGGGVNISGSVGIGTTTPGYPLEVDGYSNYNISSGAYYYLYNSIPEAEYISSSLTESISIASQGWIQAKGFISPSDRRIKDIVDRSVPTSDLATIEKLQVTDYRMKDRVQNGAKLHKGFIAQEVQEVIPEAVNQGKGFVPDIYAPADRLQFSSDNHNLRLVMAKAQTLKLGDLVRLIVDETATERTVTAVPDDKTFEVDGIAAEPKRVFVYGKQVDDFLAVDYDRIYTTGIGAIQELAKRVKTLETREAQVAALEQKASRVDALEQKVADLQKLVAQLAADSKSAKMAAKSHPEAHASAEDSLKKSFTTASLQN